MLKEFYSLIINIDEIITADEIIWTIDVMIDQIKIRDFRTPATMSSCNCRIRSAKNSAYYIFDSFKFFGKKAFVETFKLGG